jgi:hypothetical protein
MNEEQFKKIQPYLCKAKPKPKKKEKEASLYINNKGIGVITNQSESVEKLYDAVLNRQDQDKEEFLSKYNIKDLDVVKKLLIVGPSHDTKTYNADFFKRQKDEGYYILAFSGAMEHFATIEYAPDFFSFSDPTSWNKIYSRLREKCGVNFHNSTIPNNTSLIFLDMYEDFIELGFSTSASKLNEGIPNSISIYPTWSKCFDKCYSKPVNQSMICSHAMPLGVFWRDELMVYQGDRKYEHRKAKYNIDKFSAFLLPTIINYCINLKDIRVLGFGEFNTGRAAHGEQGNKLGFFEYLRSFILMSDKIKLNLQKYGIKLNFLSNQSIYHWISTLNNVPSKHLVSACDSPPKFFTKEYLESIKHVESENVLHIGDFYS